MLKEKKFNKKIYYAGILRPQDTKQKAKEVVKKLGIRGSFNYRIIKENGKYEIYVNQK